MVGVSGPGRCMILILTLLFFGCLFTGFVVGESIDNDSQPNYKPLGQKNPASSITPSVPPLTLLIMIMIVINNFLLIPQTQI